MNLLQCAPLCDSQGKVRYFIGAQVDVSGLAMDGAQMESLQALQAEKERLENSKEQVNDEDSAGSFKSAQPPNPPKSEFQELNELFSPRELQNVQQNGGSLFQPAPENISRTNSRLFLPDPIQDGEIRIGDTPPPNIGGSLTGVYKHVCPYCYSLALTQKLILET